MMKEEEKEQDGNASNEVREGGKGHHIACLFTSVDYGSGALAQDTILGKTREAIRHLRLQMQGLKKKGVEVGEFCGVRTNNEIFGIS